MNPEDVHALIRMKLRTESTELPDEVIDSVLEEVSGSIPAAVELLLGRLAGPR